MAQDQPRIAGSDISAWLPVTNNIAQEDGGPKVSPANAPSIINNEITTTRPGQKLKYSQLSAREKRDYLFDQGIRATAYGPGELPDVVGGVIQFGEDALKTYAHHSLSRSLTRVSDEFEVPTTKLFHTYGATAKITFVPEAGTSYSGLFREAAIGLGRFSYAGPVVGVGIVPALGLKFLIDGDHPSENLVAMRMLDSQQSHLPFAQRHHSVFQNALTNILPDPSVTNVVMHVVKKSFETVVETGQGLHQPVDNLAAVCTNGVPEQNVSAPYRIIFNPTREARGASDPTIDFRDDLARNIPSGTVIYDVCALDEQQEAELKRQGIVTVEDLIPHAKKIGAIRTESEFIASAYGDYRLFFKHNAKFIREEFRQQAGAAAH